MVINLNHPESWSVPNRAENPDMHVGSTAIIWCTKLRNYKSRPSSHAVWLWPVWQDTPFRNKRENILVRTVACTCTIGSNSFKIWLECILFMRNAALLWGMRRWDGLAVARPVLVTEKMIFFVAVLLQFYWHFFLHSVQISASKPPLRIARDSWILPSDHNTISQATIHCFIVGVHISTWSGSAAGLEVIFRLQALICFSHKAVLLDKNHSSQQVRQWSR